MFACILVCIVCYNCNHLRCQCDSIKKLDDDDDDLNQQVWRSATNQQGLSLYWTICYVIIVGIVFLVFRNETRPGLLPNEVTSISTVWALFVRAFPDTLSMQWFESSKWTIYFLDSINSVYRVLQDLRLDHLLTCGLMCNKIKGCTVVNFSTLRSFKNSLNSVDFSRFLTFS